MCPFKMMTNPRFGKAVEVLIGIAALALIATNVALLRQNRQLREAAAPQIAAGEQLQMLSGVTLDGHVEPISLPGANSKLLLLTFSSGCPACQENQEGWAKLANALAQKGVRVLWVSRDPVDVTRKYCLMHGIAPSVTLADPPYRAYKQLGLARVPNTVLVGSGGTVEKVWAGRLDQPGWDSVFAYFGVTHEAVSATRSTVGMITTGCASGAAGVSAKNCK
jgi:peroxiredoxin